MNSHRRQEVASCHPCLFQQRPGGSFASRAGTSGGTRGCVCVNARSFPPCQPLQFDHVEVFLQAAGCCPMRKKRAQISGESELHRALPPPHPSWLVAFTVLCFFSKNKEVTRSSLLLFPTQNVNLK